MRCEREMSWKRLVTVPVSSVVTYKLAPHDSFWTNETVKLLDDKGCFKGNLSRKLGAAERGAVLPSSGQFKKESGKPDYLFLKAVTLEGIMDGIGQKPNNSVFSVDGWEDGTREILQLYVYGFPGKTDDKDTWPIGNSGSKITFKLNRGNPDIYGGDHPYNNFTFTVIREPFEPVDIGTKRASKCPGETRSVIINCSYVYDALSNSWKWHYTEKK